MVRVNRLYVKLGWELINKQGSGPLFVDPCSFNLFTYSLGGYSRFVGKISGDRRKF